MLEDFLKVFTNRSYGTIVSAMDQITQSIKGVIYPVIVEKHQIMLTENLVLHTKL